MAMDDFLADISFYAAVKLRSISANRLLGCGGRNVLQDQYDNAVELQ